MIKGNIIIRILINQNKNKLTKKAVHTLAWSEGKDASGMCFKINFQELIRLVSGLSILTKF
jgi:hypothetical protein